MNEKTMFYKELIEKYCREKEILGVKRKFTLRGFMFYNQIPKDDIGKVVHALKILKNEGKLIKIGSKLWKWNGENGQY